MTKQVKSKKRVANHGEVFTAEREVNAMLDLVKTETGRIDSRFLEPACGDGNFLAAILKRKLDVVKKKYKKYTADFEKYSILALTSIYGVDILDDNAKQCRKRLYKIWEKEYIAICKNDVSDDVKKSVLLILNLNIVCGNALSMMCVDEQQNDTNNPIIFPEWAFVNQYMIKRRDYRFDVLLKENLDEKNHSMQYSLFTDYKTNKDNWMIDSVINEIVPKPVCDYKPINYRRIFEHEQ